MLEKEFSSAAESYAQSLILRRKTEEGGSPPITGLLNKLGEAEMKQGKSEAALQHFKEGQSATSKLLGDHHPLMALAELNIANCLAVMKNHEEARNSYQKALKIMEHTAGENHEGTASVLEEYSSYLKTCGQDEEAREIDKRIASIRENPDSRHTAINLKAVN